MVIGRTVFKKLGMERDAHVYEDAEGNIAKFRVRQKADGRKAVRGHVDLPGRSAIDFDECPGSDCQYMAMRIFPLNLAING